MSKVDDLRQKYQQIAKSTFNKFEEGDTTPTKKYLEYMLKSWVDRENYKQKIKDPSSMVLTRSGAQQLKRVTTCSTNILQKGC
jgi:predicted nucleotidyltransferase